MNHKYDIKNIPIGDYCYTLLSVEERPDGLPILHTKTCPFFVRIDKDRAFCSYIGYKNSIDDVLLFDDVKCCGINEYE